MFFSMSCVSNSFPCRTTALMSPTSLARVSYLSSWFERRLPTQYPGLVLIFKGNEKSKDHCRHEKKRELSWCMVIRTYAACMPCVCVRAYICVCVCVCVCVCHNEKKVPDEWQARHAMPAIPAASTTQRKIQQE